MTALPTSLTYFGSLSGISQIITKSALPLVEAHQMNDAFLPDRNSPFELTSKELFDVGVKFISHAILGKSAPRGQPNHSLQKAIMRWRMENRFNDESEVREALQGLLPAMVEQSLSEAKTCHANWIEYVSGKRIVPLFEKFQSLAMWEERGFSLKGAAIKFKCDEDSVFNQCTEVNYTKSPASIINVQSYVEHMTGLIPEVEFNPQNILLTQNYERRQYKEWRLLSDSTEQWLEFPFKLIQSVYLGALVSESNAEKLTNHLAKLNPKINVYHSHCKTSEFELEFDKINESEGE